MMFYLRTKITLKIFHSEIRKILKSKKCLAPKFSDKRLWTCTIMYVVVQRPLVAFEFGGYFERASYGGLSVPIALDIR